MGPPSDLPLGDTQVDETPKEVLGERGVVGPQNDFLTGTHHGP